MKKNRLAFKTDFQKWIPKKKGLVWASALWMLSGSNLCFANSTNALLQQAQALSQKQQYQQAYHLLSSVADDYAGDVEFDRFYAALVLKLNHNTLAVLILERALIVQPQHLPTQLLLLEAYQRLKSHREIKQLIEQIKQHPDFKPELLATEEAAEDEKDYQVNAYLGASVGYDDNLNNGPDDNFISLPVAGDVPPIFVGRGLERDQDFFSSVTGGVNFSLKLPQDFGLKAGFYGHRRINDKRHDEDSTLFAAWIGGSYRWQKNTVSLTLKQQNVWLSDEHYQNMYSVQGRWSYSFSRYQLLSLYANGELSRYEKTKILDADGYNLGVIFYQQLTTPLTPLLSIELHGGEEQISDAAYDYLGYASIGVRLGSRFKIVDNGFFFLNTAFQHRHYKAANPFFLTPRDDRRYSVTGRYSHYFFNKKLAVSLQGSWQLNESNIELYDYQRNFATIGFQWNF